MPIYHTLFTMAELLPILNLLVLTITVVVLIIYARDTNRIANQTQEANLRPVILRAGYIKGWSDLKPYRGNQSDDSTRLVFTSFKNIATDISGSIVINKYKYRLLFGNEVTKIESRLLTSDRATNQESHLIVYQLKWGWIPAATIINALFKEDDRESVNEENQIRINYRDIEGNEFFTIEDSNFVQKCFRK
jgi:hypothetical protein